MNLDVSAFRFHADGRKDVGRTTEVSQSCESGCGESVLSLAETLRVRVGGYVPSSEHLEKPRSQSEQPFDGSISSCNGISIKSASDWVSKQLSIRRSSSFHIN